MADVTASGSLMRRSHGVPAVLWALAVFALTYALLAVPSLPRLVRRALPGAPSLALTRWTDRLFGRPGIALGGGLVVVLAGSLGASEIWAAIDWRTLALLLGMMLLVAALEAAGVFTALSMRLVARLRTPRRVLIGSMAVVAVLSALVLNDAVVLLFTPVLIRAARAMQAPVFPFLAGEAFAANIGSVATPVGNPQNAAIALATGLDFVPFAIRLAPLSLVSLAIAMGMMLLVFGKSMGQRAQGLADSVPSPADSPRRLGTTAGPRVAHAAPLTSHRMLHLALGSVALALAGFVVGPAFGVPLWVSALGAGTLALLLAPAARVSPVRLARSVDGGILVFFIGLFLLLGAVRGAGVTERLDALVANGSPAAFVAGVALLSNLVSNVPAVLMLLPAIGTEEQALLLAASSTLAGNLTFLGSAATVIVAQTAGAMGEAFDVGRFTLVGLPLAALTLVLAVVWLT